MSGLIVSDLHIGFRAAGPSATPAEPVRSCSLQVKPGEVVGLVGESGCGKSLTALACLGLLPPNALSSGTVLIDGTDVLSASPAQRQQLRGRKIAMIFQNPMTALNPFFTIGAQIQGVIETHFKLSRREALDKVRQALERVQLDPSSAAKFPHQMSGGQLQRAMIAMAVACEPSVLIADEPTTALDVTVQARIMQLLKDLAGQGMGLLLITHDLALVSQVANRVYVMYAGRVMESGSAGDLFVSPSHPYTAGLLQTQPQLGQHARRLPVIEGRVPPANQRIRGCVFRERCGRAIEPCAASVPAFVSLRARSEVACHHPILPRPSEAPHAKV